MSSVINKGKISLNCQLLLNLCNYLFLNYRRHWLVPCTNYLFFLLETKRQIKNAVNALKSSLWLLFVFNGF